MCLLLAGTGFSLDKVALVDSGRDGGQITAATEGNTVYLDVQKTARKLGAGVELFARSKQAKITTRGFYAILTASTKEILLNAQSVWLEEPVLEKDGNLLAPVSFFLLPQFQQAMGKEISFADNALIVERPFDLARTDNELSATEDQLVFTTRRAVTWQIETPTSQRVHVILPDRVVKRDESFRLKNGFISSVSISQNRNDAVIKIKLGKKGKFWDVATPEGKLLIRVGAEPLAPLAAATAPKAQPAAAKPAPAKPTTASAAKSAKPAKQTAAKSDSSAPAAVQTPSVLEEADELLAEKPATAEGAETVIKAAPAATMTAAPSATPTQIKAAPAAVMTTAHKKMRIVVDPGHGGKDPGAVRSRVREIDLNLAVSKELFKLLKKGGFEVKITRDNDTFIALSERSKAANNFKADLFVSVHTNASKNKSANGFQVYFRSEKATDKEAAETAALENEAMQYEEVHYNFVDALLQSLAKNEYINESSKLAGYVRNAVYKQPGIGIGVNHNDSVRQANFYVLKGVQSPAILVEMGYISSQKDRGRLTQGKVQKNMAQGIYNGIYNYAKQEGWLN